MESTIENEICIGGNISIPRIQRRLKGVQVSVPSVQLYSVYFDDSHCSLIRNGIGLRLRKEGDRLYQTLKIEFKHYRRKEWTRMIKSKFAAPVTKQYLDIDSVTDIFSQTGIHFDFNLQKTLTDLEIIFKVDVQRKTWTLPFRGSEIELALDLGTILSGKAVEKISEIEIELINGDPLIIWQLASELATASPNLFFEPQSKAFRGAILAGIPPSEFEHYKINSVFEPHPTKLLAQNLYIIQKKLSYFFLQYCKTGKQSLLKETIKIIKAISNQKLSQCVSNRNNYSRTCLKNLIKRKNLLYGKILSPQGRPSICLHHKKVIFSKPVIKRKLTKNQLMILRKEMLKFNIELGFFCSLCCK